MGISTLSILLRRSDLRRHGSRQAEFIERVFCRHAKPHRGVGLSEIGEDSCVAMPMRSVSANRVSRRRALESSGICLPHPGRVHGFSLPSRSAHAPRSADNAQERVPEFVKHFNNQIDAAAELRDLFGSAETTRSPSRSTRWSRRRKSSSASGPAMSLGSLSRRGPFNAGDRDEPDRRPLEHRRRRRGSELVRSRYQDGDCSPQR